MIELQEMLAHQQLDLSRMSDELYAQQKEIAELKANMKRLHEQLAQVGGHEGNGANEPPPHY